MTGITDWRDCQRLQARAHSYRRVGLAAILILAVLIVAVHNQSRLARGASSGPIIHWNASMIYAGQNNGYPWGPVGENASVAGENFSPGQQVSLVLAKGDSNTGAATCKNPVATVGSASADSTGKFYQNFSWPIAAGVVNQEYSICALSTTNRTVVSSHDDGPFTVLSSSPPVIDISTTSLAAGTTVTVTGQNWVPPQQVNINIAGCADCEPGNTEVASSSVASSGLNTGSFSVTMTIPTSTSPGNYVVNAFTQSGMDANYITGVKHLTVTSATASATPTSTAIATATTTTTTTTPTVTVTAISTSTVTPTTIPTNNSNTSTSSNDGGGGSSFITIGLLVAVVVVILAIIAVAIFLLRQRSAKRRTPPDNSTPPNPHRPPLSPQPPNNYGQFAQQSSQFNDFQPTMQQQVPPNTYGQFAQQSSSLPQYGQQNGPSPQSGQFGPSPMSSSNYSPVAYPSQCRNCSRPLAPNAMRCNVCGMPVSNPV